MARHKSSNLNYPIKKGGIFIPALCNIIGTLILLAVICISLPLSVPHLLGYGIYNVESGSMEPALPVGSVVYSEYMQPRDVVSGDIIVFSSHGTIVTHRVVTNQYFYEEFITKGDANDKEDINPVPYADFIGRVKYHIPYIGPFLTLCASNIGKAYLLGLALCGLMFNILAAQIRRRAEEKFAARVARWERLQAARSKAELDELRRQK